MGCSDGYTEKGKDQNDEYEEKFSGKISALLNANRDLIFPAHPTERNSLIITEEVYDRKATFTVKYLRNLWVSTS